MKRWAEARAFRAGLAVLATLAASAAGAATETCAPGVADLRDPDTSARFQIDVMDTPEARARGMMFRETLPRSSGMLFVYETPQPVAFWMENTLIPLDMLFFDPQGRLTRIHANAKPRDRTPIPGGDNVLYVLEINGGTAEALDIELGAELRHPAIDPGQAVWACDPG